MEKVCRGRKKRTVYKYEDMGEYKDVRKKEDVRGRECGYTKYIKENQDESRRGFSKNGNGGYM